MQKTMIERCAPSALGAVAVLAMVWGAGAVTAAQDAPPPGSQPDDGGSHEEQHEGDSQGDGQWEGPAVELIPTECHPDLVLSCEAIGGVASMLWPSLGMPGDGSSLPQCVCDVIVEGGPRIVNARRGDVALVPMTDPAGLAGGDANVAAVMGAIGQWHRHTLLFSDAGTEVTHLTTYAEFGPSDVQVVGLGGARIDPFLMEHGARVGDPPSDTLRVAQPLADALSASDRRLSRIDNTGLILKPFSESDRPQFEAAATRAELMSFYYRVSDYTIFSGTSATGLGPSSRLGTHCAGLIFEAFKPDFPGLSLVSYSEPTRLAAGNALFTQVRDRVRTTIGGTAGFFTGWPTDIGNQAVNCFAGLGCDLRSGRWRRAAGLGRTVSPDNLLPFSFSVTNVSDLPDFSDPTVPPICSSPFVNCDHATTNLQGGFAVTRVAPNQVDASHTNGQSGSPFQRIEPQVIADGSVGTVRLYRW
jgi:hypothetical protein